MKQFVIKLNEQDYRELLRCVRWVASDAVSEPNRTAAFGLAKRIEDGTEEIDPEKNANPPKRVR